MPAATNCHDSCAPFGTQGVKEVMVAVPIGVLLTSHTQALNHDFDTPLHRDDLCRLRDMHVGLLSSNSASTVPRARESTAVCEARDPPANAVGWESHHYHRQSIFAAFNFITCGA